MSSKKYRILLSGSGADEIMTDYGFNGNKIYYHSEFGGLFPDNLESIFPWKKFYDDTQRSYLFKDEFIAGTHHIEGRYPFLDPRVVQEWLWLTPDIKNKIYKCPMKELFDIHNYPYAPNVKTGFSI
jgi:asparagine synthetase B (glutamine-hydrolysing)